MKKKINYGFLIFGISLVSFLLIIVLNSRQINFYILLFITFLSYFFVYLPLKGKSSKEILSSDVNKHSRFGMGWMDWTTTIVSLVCVILVIVLIWLLGTGTFDEFLVKIV